MKRKNILAMGLVLLISAAVFACGCVDEDAPAAPTPATPVATPTAAPTSAPATPTPVTTPAVASAPAPAPTTVLDETTTMYVDEYMSYSERLDKGDTITISVTTDGNPVDLFLMNAQDFGEYERMQTGYRETFTYYVAGSALHVASKTYAWEVPESNTYYIVADNTDAPDGGAYAGRAVNVHVVMTG